MIAEEEKAVTALTKWIKKKGGHDIKIGWTQVYSSEVRVAASYTIQRGEWTQTIDGVYSVEKPMAKNPMVKHEYNIKFCETNGRETINWI